MLRPGQRVRTTNGRLGVVVAAPRGTSVEVVFPEGTELVHVADLSAAEPTVADVVASGSLSDFIEFDPRLRALFLEHAYRFDPRSGLSNVRLEEEALLDLQAADRSVGGARDRTRRGARAWWEDEPRNAAIARRRCNASKGAGRARR
jgi:hypothetical protein